MHPQDQIPPAYRDAVAFETRKWDTYFLEALKGRGQEHEASSWWRISDRDSVQIVRDLFAEGRPISALEAGCGSGGTSLELARHVPLSRLALVDASESALRFCRCLTAPELQGRTEYVRADIAALPYPDGEFDLVWNVGVVEHYPPEGIRLIVREMARVTRPGGAVVVAIPNRNSIAVQKAWLLGTRFGRKMLASVPGYRFDTEILYGNAALRRLLAEASGGDWRVEFGGNALWVGAPEPLVSLSDRMLKRSRFSFLSFFTLRRP